MKIVFAIPKLQFPFRIVSNEVRGKCGYNFHIEIEILQSEKVTTQRGGDNYTISPVPRKASRILSQQNV